MEDKVLWRVSVDCFVEIKPHCTYAERRTSTMYARIVTGQYQPGKIDEGLQILLNSVLPAAICRSSLPK